MKCPVCGKGVLQPADDILSELEGYAFLERGDRCPQCGEEFINEADSARTIRVARRLGIWREPLKFRLRLSTTRRGIVLRIPEDFRRSMKIKGDERVSLVKVGNRRIVLDLEAAPE